MPKALEKGNTSPKLRKMFFLAQKLAIFFQNSVFDETQFSQKSLINRKNQPHTLPQQILVQQTPIITAKTPVVTTSSGSAELPGSGGTGERDKNSEGRGARRQGLI